MKSQGSRINPPGINAPDGGSGEIGLTIQERLIQLLEQRRKFVQLVTHAAGSYRVRVRHDNPDFKQSGR
jgi:hypothetical protein